MQPFLFTVTALLAIDVAVAADENSRNQASNVTNQEAFTFEEIDQNRDGRLNPDEARQSEELTTYFMVWDTDQNGQLDPDEIRAGRNETPPASESDKHDGISYAPNFTVIDFATRPDFSRLDANGDGALAPAEWAESNSPMPFSAADANADGLLDESEFADALEPRTPANDNESGREEFDIGEDRENEEPIGPGTDRRIQMMSDDLDNGVQFAALDTDDNAMIDRLEATDNNYVLAHFEEWDVDNNELLDPEEIERARLELDVN